MLRVLQENKSRTYAFKNIARKLKKAELRDILLELHRKSSDDCVCDQKITNLFLLHRILSKILLVTTLLMEISSYSTPLFTHKVKTDYFSVKKTKKTLT